MCYSAQIRADYTRFVREYGATLSLKDFYDLFWRRLADPKVIVPQGVEAAFATPQSEEEREIKKLIAQYASDRELEYRQEQDKQRARLAAAEQKLSKKVTKAATEDVRIATNKIKRLEVWIQDLHRTQEEAVANRIFPGTFVPVMIMEAGRRVLKPMRYHCRPWNKPASFDTEYPGCYNARRDSLKGFWKGMYGATHGVVVLSSFYEYVPLHLVEGRTLEPGEKPRSIIVEFTPQPAQDLLAACVWSRWSRPGEPDLLSFALITDDPPPEIRMVGHDRCIVPIDPKNLDDWLQPSQAHIARQDQILDEQVRPFFAYRRADKDDLADGRGE